MATASTAKAGGAESEEELLVEHGHAATKPRSGGPAWLGCAFNLLNGTLGPGMLVLPLAFHRTGLPLGALLVVVIWCFSYLALLLLLDTCARMHTSSLVMLGRMHGAVMSTVIDGSVLLYFYGTCISYLILIEGTFATLVRQLDAEGPPGSSSHPWLAAHGGTMLLSGCAAAVILPLSCSRSIEKLGGCSSLIVVLYGFITLIVWSSPASAPAEPPALAAAPSCLSAHACAVHHGWPIVRAMPTIAYCFSSQAVYPPGLEAIRAQHSAAVARKVSRRITDGTFSLTLFLYLAVGVGGFVAVPGTPPTNVLNGYTAAPPLVLAQLSLICALSISYPVMFVVARAHFFSLASSRLDIARHHRRVTFVGVCLSMIVAVGFPEVESVLGLLGATSSVSLSFIIPAMLYQKLVLGSAAPQPSHYARWVPKLLIGVGLLVAALSIPVQAYEMEQQSHRVAFPSLHVFFPEVSDIPDVESSFQIQ